MRILIQRVSRASVTVKDEVVGSIGSGFLVFVGFTGSDDQKTLEYLAQRLVQLRICEDEHGKMNLSVSDTGGKLLVISQFTLYADTRKGNRPNFMNAAPPDQAKGLYVAFVEYLRGLMGEANVQTGIFGAMMEVELVNSGPVTIVLERDSPERDSPGHTAPVE